LFKPSGNTNKIATYVLIVICIVAISWWQFKNPTNNIVASVPGLDNKPKNLEGVSELVKIGEGFDFFMEKETFSKNNWPRFRGSDIDNIAKENVGVKTSWNDSYPKQLWKIDLGEGHAAPAIYDGTVYLLDYDETKKADALRCFDLETGQELWRRWYRVNIKRNHGISRTVPAVSEKYVVTIGPRCHVMCTDRKTGDFIWGKDLERDYKIEIPFWYTGQCPLIDEKTAVVAVGGDKLLLGIDCETGDILWDTPNEHNLKMSHSSVIPMTLQGKKMYVYCAIGGIVGISAEEEDKGKLLWLSQEWKPSVVAPSPVLLNDNKIFASAGYGAGSILLQIEKSNDGFSAKLLQQIKPNEGLASEQQTPIYHDNKLYGILPKDAGTLRNEFVCCNPNDISEIIWSSGKTNRFGLGPYILIDDKFFILDDNGTLYLAKERNNTLNILTQKKVLDGHDAWGPFALADGKLLLRDSKQMICLDLKGGGS